MTTASSARDRESQVEHEELLAWLETVQSVAGVGGALARLFHAELRLAFSSVRRILILAVVIIPVAAFAWLGLSMLLCWLIYWLCAQSMTQDGAIVAALSGFLLLQVSVICLIAHMVKVYRKDLRFSATRRHLRSFGEELGHALQTTKG